MRPLNNFCLLLYCKLEYDGWLISTSFIGFISKIVKLNKIQYRKVIICEEIIITRYGNYDNLKVRDLFMKYIFQNKLVQCFPHHFSLSISILYWLDSMMLYSIWLNQQEKVVKEQPSQYPDTEQVNPVLQEPYCPPHRCPGPPPHSPHSWYSSPTGSENCTSV